MINPYFYVKQPNSVNCSLKSETGLWTQYAVDLSSAFPSKHLGNSKIMGEYFFPKGKIQAPLAILIHGMGDRSVIPCHLIARTLAKNGIASFILYLVFHTYRVPEPIKGRYPKLTAEEWFESYQVSVIDVQQVLDWVNSRREIIQDRIAVLGISFGSFISTIAMALDNRIRAGVLIESGGNSDKIMKHSLLLRWQYKYNPLEYYRNQEAYLRYLMEVAEKGFENVNAEKSSYLTDPLTFSVYLKDRPLIMLNALFDEIIPRKATIDLWQASGKPPIKWYPSTHASIWMWYPLIGPRIARFLRAALSSPGHADNYCQTSGYQ